MRLSEERHKQSGPGTNGPEAVMIAAQRELESVVVMFGIAAAVVIAIPVVA